MNLIIEPITNGFGTVLSAEYDLLNTLRGLIDVEIGDFRPHEIHRLAHQTEEVGAIIALLQQRDALLPTPRRFDALDHCTTALTHPINGLPQIPEQSLANLLKKNENLRHSIQALIEQSGHRDDNEFHLREAARRHEAMESTLVHLVDEEALRNRSVVEFSDLPKEPAT